MGHLNDNTPKDASSTISNQLAQGARLLSEQGRLAWLLGEGLQTLINEAADDPDPQTLAAKGQAWLQAALDHTPARTSDPLHAESSAKAHAKRDRATSHSPTHKQFPLVSWETINRRRLDDRAFPVLYIGAERIRGRWASLALAVDLNGNKHALGGLSGSESERLPPELAARGLSGDDGLLVVTDGRERLDAAITRTWPGRARIQHCLYRLRQDLKAHLPQSAGDELDADFPSMASLPALAARERLEALVTRWKDSHPGAAARLHRSLDAALTVARLEVAEPLRSRLQAQGLLRVVCEQAVRMGGAPGPGLAGLAGGLGIWLERTRRFVGREDLPRLAEALRRACEGPATPTTNTTE